MLETLLETTLELEELITEELKLLLVELVVPEDPLLIGSTENQFKFAPALKALMPTF